MKQFYLAFIVNGFIGLAIGWLWGCYDGFKVGYEKGAETAEKRLRGLLTAKTGKHPQTTENG